MPRLTPANTITVPADFDPLNPGTIFAALPRTGVDSAAVTLSNQHVITPLLVREEWQARTKTKLRVIAFDLALDLGTANITLRSRSLVAADDVLIAPTVVAAVAAVPPSVFTGASVAVPAAVVAVAGVPPAVLTALVVEVPAAAMTVVALAPKQVGRPRIEVAVPVAVIEVAGVAPTLLTGTFIEVPSSVVTVAGLTPTVDTYGDGEGLTSGLPDLYGATQDWQPAGWV